MASLNFVGPRPDDDEGVLNRLYLDSFIDEGNSRSYANGRIAAQIALRASKSYVDSQDSTFAEVAYMTTRDALNVPKSSKGVAGGVATLDADGKIPASQVPSIGTAIYRGPYGATNVNSGTTSGQTPLKIADYNIGVTGWKFQPLPYLLVQVEVSGDALPIVEARIGTQTDTTYASQQLVARGRGRARTNTVQAVTVLSGGVPGLMSDGVPDFYDTNLNALLSVWVYNAAETGSIEVSGNALFAGAVFIARVAL